MLEYLTPAEARHTPIYAAVMADFLGRASSATRPAAERPRDAHGRFVKAAPAHQCREAGCARWTSSHVWDAETCPAPEAVADE